MLTLRANYKVYSMYRFEIHGMIFFYFFFFNFKFALEQIGCHVLNGFLPCNNRSFLYSFITSFWISNILDSEKMLFNYSVCVLLH